MATRKSGPSRTVSATAAEPLADPPPASVATMAVRPAPAQRARRTDLVKFTATLEPETVERFERVTASMRPVGRLAGGRYPSRADVLRAVLALVEEDDKLVERLRDRVQMDLSTPS